MELSDSPYDEILTDFDDEEFEYSMDLTDSFSTAQVHLHPESEEHLLPELNSDEEMDIMVDALDEDFNDMADLDAEVEMSPGSEHRSPLAANRIENMVLSFLGKLAGMGDSEGTPDPDLQEQSAKRRRDKGKDMTIELQLVDRRKTTNLNDPKYKFIKFPSKAAGGSARTLGVFIVLDITHEAVSNNVPVTKRDMYYQDVPLFKNQKIVDTLVDDLAATFQLERSDLNIRATSKGLISGCGFSIHLLSGDCINTLSTEGTLIPAGEDIQSFSIDEDISWVLVVEKEALFQTLSQMNIVDHSLMPGRGLLITGKGYPDIATRHLVKSLADALPRSIPIMALVDADPYGLDILSVYKYGSRALQHENTKLAAKRIKWLGLWSSELESFGIDKSSLIPVTKQDAKKALTMLGRPSFALPKRWKKELQHMLYTRRKAEVEILSSTANPSALGGVVTNWERTSSPHIYSPKDIRHDGTNSPCSTPPSSQEPDRSCTGFQHSSCRTPSDSYSGSPEPLPALLLRYLASKIAVIVSSARARADAEI